MTNSTQIHTLSPEVEKRFNTAWISNGFPPSQTDGILTEFFKDFLKSELSLAAQGGAELAVWVIENHTILPTPNPYGTTIRVEKHNQIIKEATERVKKALTKEGPKWPTTYPHKK